MILVDSSVWIDFLRAQATPQIARLEEYIRQRRVAIGDLMLVEVLQGIPSDRDFDQAVRLFANFPAIAIATPQSAIEAARHYRSLRAKGVTIRKAINTLIATRCILDGLPLLFSDRDFEPYVEHLGLVDAMAIE